MSSRYSLATRRLVMGGLVFGITMPEAKRLAIIGPTKRRSSSLRGCPCPSNGLGNSISAIVLFVYLFTSIVVLLPFPFFKNSGQRKTKKKPPHWGSFGLGGGAPGARPTDMFSHSRDRQV